LTYFEKCLSATKNAKQLDKEAVCYYKIGIIWENMEDLEEAVVNVNKFLEIEVNKEKD